MPPHRDWTRRGAGRALLYWPLTAFLLAAAFPALAVPLVLGSGLALLTLGIVGGALGKRWRASKLARARRGVSGVARVTEALPEAPAAWPTGRHARRSPEVAGRGEEPAHPGSPQPRAA